jgi:hypothetical protein
MTDSYISEDEACAYCGVNAITLKRYTKAGYLKPKTLDDGSISYIARELSEVFELPPYKPTKFLSSIEVKSEINKETKISSLIEPDKKELKKIEQLKVKIVQLENLLLERDKQIVDKCDIIDDLKQQREWLQKRVERHEEQSSHDKLLLLNEARTVSRLIDDNQLEQKHVINSSSRDSFIKKILKLLGLVRENKPPLIISETKSGDYKNVVND